MMPLFVAAYSVPNTSPVAAEKRTKVAPHENTVNAERATNQVGWWIGSTRARIARAPRPKAIAVVLYRPM